MSSDTPRTDAHAKELVDYGNRWKYHPDGQEVDADFARQLERELATAIEWEKSVLTSFPPMQEIGKELGVQWGDSIHDKILPGILALKAELERERLRLAACGVVANANTRDSARAQREMHPDYRSASCDDVARAVDREMNLRDCLANAEAEIERMKIDAGKAFCVYCGHRGPKGEIVDHVKSCDKHPVKGMAEALAREKAENAMLTETLLGMRHATCVRYPERRCSECERIEQALASRGRENPKLDRTASPHG